MNVEQGWIEWNGGECPVEPEARVNAMLRDGDTSLTQPAGWYSWAHKIPGETPAWDIIAYRIVEPGK